MRGSELDESGLRSGHERLPVIGGVQIGAGFVAAAVSVGHVVERLERLAEERHVEVGDGRLTLPDDDRLARGKIARLLKRELVGPDGNVVNLIDAVEKREVPELVALGGESRVGDGCSRIGARDAAANASDRTSIGAELCRSEAAARLDPLSLLSQSRVHRVGVRRLENTERLFDVLRRPGFDEFEGGPLDVVQQEGMNRKDLGPLIPTAEERVYGERRPRLLRQLGPADGGVPDEMAVVGLGDHDRKAAPPRHSTMGAGGLVQVLNVTVDGLQRVRGQIALVNVVPGRRHVRIGMRCPDVEGELRLRVVIESVRPAVVPVLSRRHDLQGAQQIQVRMGGGIIPLHLPDAGVGGDEVVGVHRHRHEVP